ncbi:MAG: hypothetical protein E2O66_05095 [Deltaproteobacteria bacterium]|nr:MAG: hypothetical protein E2O66_05095 [Deltaproteobacteria bacterium]TDJ20457.1 MAG: hypothetical protein E2O69_03700 [Deltaproteobacteria bacterium]
MKTAAAWVAIVLCALATAAGAQPGSQTAAERAGVPPGNGAISGRVIGASEAGIDIVLYALPTEAEPGLAYATTDAEGRFLFKGVDPNPTTAYLVGARSAGVPFGSRGRFKPGATTLEIDIEVTASSSDASNLRIGEVTLRIDRSCEGIQLRESHQLLNDGQQVIYIPEDQRGSEPPLLRATLPAGASGLTPRTGLLPEGLEQEGNELRFWGPVYPGSQEFEFSYGLAVEGDAISFSRDFPTQVARVAVIAADGGPRISGRRLQAGEPLQIEGRIYRTLEALDIQAGESLEFHVDLPIRAPAPILLVRSQILVEMDDAALEVDEQLVLQVEGSEPLVATHGAPLLCIHLPAGASGLRFDRIGLAMGLGHDPSGALALRGPIPAGNTTLAIGYRIPVGEDGVVFERRFPRHLPLLLINVADTGILAETDRLHRLPTARGNDRSYLRLEAFEIEANEPVRVRFSQLPAPRPTSRLANTGFALVLGAVALLVLIEPLRRAKTSVGTETRQDELAFERESVYAAIRDVDEDFDTGKLTVEDHSRMRAELRRRAIGLLEAERNAQQKPEPATEQHQASARCAACDAELPDSARFCPGCGTAVGGEGQQA